MSATLSFHLSLPIFLALYTVCTRHANDRLLIELRHLYIYCPLAVIATEHHFSLSIVDFSLASQDFHFSNFRNSETLLNHILSKTLFAPRVIHRRVAVYRKCTVVLGESYFPAFYANQPQCRPAQLSAAQNDGIDTTCLPACLTVH